MNINDRELLKFAAKAAGYQIARWEDDWSAVLLVGERNSWNPLTDDGDALRLAVKLRMQVSVTIESCRAETLPRLGVRVTDKDEMLATRRAIVRAAAEIDRNGVAT